MCSYCKSHSKPNIIFLKRRKTKYPKKHKLLKNNEEVMSKLIAIKMTPLMKKMSEELK